MKSYLKFYKGDVFARIGIYSTLRNQLKITLVTASGSPVAEATVQVGATWPVGTAVIKDQLENEGVYKTLLMGGIIHPSHNHLYEGVIELLICNLVK